MKNKTKITIASVTALTIFLSSCGISLSRKSPYEGNTLIESTTKYEQYTDYTDGYDNTVLFVDSDNEKDETDIVFYRKKMQQISKEKNFDQYTIEMLSKTIDYIEKNYDTLYEVLGVSSRLPSKKEFLESFIQNIEKNIDFIIFVDTNDFSNEDVLKLENAQAKFLRETNTIIIDKKLSDESIVLNIIHEETHSEQDYVFESNDCMQHNMYNIFTEGEAAWRTTLVSQNCVKSNKMISINDNSYFLYGVGASNYSVYSRYYKMLIDLAGYDTLQQCKEKFDYQLLIDKIESRYDINAEEFLSCIADVSSMVDIDKNHDDMKKAVTAENIYLDCIRMDIEKADTQEDVLNIFNKYRYYKLQYSVIAYDCNDNNITNEHFGINELEETLLNKVNEFEILPENKNKEIFDLCLFNFPDVIPGKEEISLMSILYYEENDKVYFCGKSKNDIKVYDCSTNFFEYIQFDEEIYEKCISVIGQTPQKSI